MSKISIPKSKVLFVSNLRSINGGSALFSILINTSKEITENKNKMTDITLSELFCNKEMPARNEIIVAARKKDPLTSID